MTEKERIYYELLLLRCGRDDINAKEELVELWDRKLFYYVQRLVDSENEAWDVMQDTWLHVFRNLGSIRNATSLPAWLYSIARNRAVSRMRKKIAHYKFEDNSEDILNIPDNNEIFEFEDADQVHSALSELSVAHREVLTLFFLEDLSVEESARVIGVPEGTVKSRLYYAKKALKIKLERRDRL